MFSKITVVAMVAFLVTMATGDTNVAIPSHFATYDALVKDLQKNGFNAEGDNVVKIFVLGNKGVGKSLLGNAALGADIFHHHIEYSKKHPHKEKEVRQYGLLYPPTRRGVRTAVVVINIPGLTDHEADVAERNRVELDAALREFPRARSSFLYILNGTLDHGLKPSDVETMHEVYKYMPDAFRSMLVIVNTREDPYKMKSTLRESGYESALRQVLQKHAPVPNLHVEFVYEVHHNQRMKFNSAQMQDLRWKLMSMTGGLRVIAVPLTVPSGQLRLLKEDGSAATHAVSTAVRQLNAQLKQDSDGWKRTLTKVAETQKDSHAGLVGRITEALLPHHKKSLPMKGIPEDVFHTAESIEL
jgi:predicted GTPase